MRRLAARLICVAVVVVSPFLPRQASSVGAATDVRRVLLINDLGIISSPGFAEVDQAVLTGLRESPYRIEFYEESLDATLFPDRASQASFREEIIQKYSARKPDAIIAAGPESLKFIAALYDHFQGTPVIFCAIWAGIPDELGHGGMPSFTGVLAQLQPEGTLNAALHLLPNTKHVVVVGGVGKFDQGFEAIAKQSFHDYESKLEFQYLFDLPMPALLERLKHLPSDTIVYHTAISQDAAGERFIDSAQSVPMVASAANAPVFVMDDVNLRAGAVGGDLVNWVDDGRMAAKMAVRVLNGENPHDIPVATSKHAYMFDWRALKRWGMNEKNLPPGSIVLNRQPTVWESYKAYIIGGISFMLAEALLIFGLVWQRARAKRAETELAMTFDRLRLAVEAGKSVGWEWDIRSGRDRWFGDLETVFGIPSDNYSGHVDDFRRKVHPDDRELIWQAVAYTRQNQKPYAAEFRVIRADGTVRWITARGRFYYAHNGDPERMLGMAVDITDRKQAEQKLRDSEDRLAGIVGSAMDAIVAVDEGRRIVLFNTAAEKMFGCTQDEALGTVIDRFIPERLRLDTGIHAGLFGESGVTTRDMGTAATLWAVRTNGQEFPMEASITHLESDGGKLFTVIIRDITERHRAEEAIRESEERFRLLANTAPVMIWTAGTDRKCSYVNKTWLDFTGRTLEEELGDSWAGGLHPDDAPGTLQTYMEAFDRKESFEMQYRLRRNDGEYRWVLDKGVPRFNPDGTFAGYIASCIDITERKLAEASLATIGRRLIEAHEEERTWIGRELHDDINQRLALLAVELDRWTQPSPPTEPLSEKVRHAQKRITQIAKDVQGLSHRLHSSKLEYLGLARAANSFCKELSEQTKVEIQFNHSEIPRTLSKEVSLCLFRVLQEALQNAVKYSGVRSFTVNLHGTAESIELTVSDTGTGFEEQDAFTRHGLGLISMRERLQLVHGELTVKSKPGAGTTIRARVPLKTGEYRAMAG